MKRIACLAAACLALAGCDQLFQDKAAQGAEEAQKKANEGNYAAAILAYESALDGSPKSADIHFRLGLIYDDKLKEPVSAVHHFQRYLDLAPKGSHAKDARNFIKEDELKLVTSMSKGALMTQEESARLKNENLQLRKQLNELRATRTAAVKGGTPGEPVQKPIPPGAKTYVVQQGDTLASISRKFYKKSGRWKDIQDANFNELNGTVKLKSGMTLIIP